MSFAECTQWEGDVSGNEGQEVEWCDISELRRRELPPADVPLVEFVEHAASRYAQSCISIAT